MCPFPGPGLWPCLSLPDSPSRPAPPRAARHGMAHDQHAALPRPHFLACLPLAPPPPCPWAWPHRQWRVSTWLGHGYMRQFQQNYLAAVEEPFDVYDNTARSVGSFVSSMGHVGACNTQAGWCWWGGVLGESGGAGGKSVPWGSGGAKERGEGGEGALHFTCAGEDGLSLPKVGGSVISWLPAADPWRLCWPCATRCPPAPCPLAPTAAPESLASRPCLAALTHINNQTARSLQLAEGAPILTQAALAQDNCHMQPCPSRPPPAPPPPPAAEAAQLHAALHQLGV